MILSNPDAPAYQNPLQLCADLCHRPLSEWCKTPRSAQPQWDTLEPPYKDQQVCRLRRISRQAYHQRKDLPNRVRTYNINVTNPRRLQNLQAKLGHDKTWMDFQKLFIEAQADLYERHQTSSQGGYRSGGGTHNMMGSQETFSKPGTSNSGG